MRVTRRELLQLVPAAIASYGLPEYGSATLAPTAVLGYGRAWRFKRGVSDLWMTLQNLGHVPERLLLTGTAEGIEGGLARATVDELFVALVGHGDAKEGDAPYFLAADQTRITAQTLGAWLDRAGARHAVVLLQGCKSGDFIPYLQGAGRVIMTASEEGENSYGVYMTTFFARAFAFDYMTQVVDGVDIGSDRDGDGRVSVWEAYDYARRLNPVAHQETPVYWEAEEGLGKRLFLEPRWVSHFPRIVRGAGQ